MGWPLAGLLDLGGSRAAGGHSDENAHARPRRDADSNADAYGPHVTHTDTVPGCHACQDRDAYALGPNGNASASSYDEPGLSGRLRVRTAASLHAYDDPPCGCGKCHPWSECNDHAGVKP